MMLKLGKLRAKNLYLAAKATQLFGNEVLRLLFPTGEGRELNQPLQESAIGSRSRSISAKSPSGTFNISPLKNNGGLINRPPNYYPH